MSLQILLVLSISYLIVKGMGDYRSITVGAADCLFAPLFSGRSWNLSDLFKVICSRRFQAVRA